MLSGLLLQITTFLTSLGLGDWMGAGGSAGARMARGRMLPDDPDAQVILLSNEIDTWMAQPEQSISNMPYHLHQVLGVLNNSEPPGIQDPDRIFTGIDSYCGSCRILSKMVIGYSKLGGPMDIIANFIVKICYLVAYQSINVCKGIINQDKVRLQWILRNTDANADGLCSLVLGSHGCGTFHGKGWSIALPPPLTPTHELQGRFLQPPPPLGHIIKGLSFEQSSTFVKEDGGSTYSEVPQAHSSSDSSDNVKNQKQVLKVLHLTDPHYDPEYRVGSNAVCNAPLCCNSDSGTPVRKSDGAGKWGDYRNCDSPRWLLQHMLHHVTTNHPDVDYILCTGDLVPHHIWKITKQDNIEILDEMTDLLLSYYPNIPIYGAIGNHESFPRDSFPPPEVPEVWNRFGIQWLYDTVAEQWSRWMHQPVAATARYAGYYSVLIRPGFRIISINTNYCYRLNWWLLYKSVDPGLVLRWLTGELQLAEARGELVHIIGHIPPFYTDCVEQWAHQFSRIVSRYSHIIRGQFFGHSHLDEFRIHYDVKAPHKPIGIQYVTPNNGPFHDLNPSYRIFYIDGDHPDTTRNVLDYETWVMNLTHANLYDDPHWYQLYSARRDLQLPSLAPRHWDQLVQRMARDPQMFARYHRYQTQDSDSAIAKGCDEKCRRTTLCSIVEGDKLMPRKCRPHSG